MTPRQERIAELRGLTTDIRADLLSVEHLRQSIADVDPDVFVIFSDMRTAQNSMFHA